MLNLLYLKRINQLYSSMNLANVTDKELATLKKQSGYLHQMIINEIETLKRNDRTRTKSN